MSISGGVTTAQFNGRNPISKMDNLVRSLLRRENYLKIFEKEFAKVQYTEEIKNGIYFSTSLEFANRKPLYNTTNYSYASQNANDPYTSNNPLDPTNYSSPMITRFLNQRTMEGAILNPKTVNNRSIDKDPLMQRMLDYH